MKRSFLRLLGVRCDWPQRVPATATFEQESGAESYVRGRFTYKAGSASVTWSLKDDLFNGTGEIMRETYFDRKGLRHGLEFERQLGGSVQWQVPWVHGHMHGIARQFDENGSELMRTRFIRGSGVDLYSNGCGLNELHVFRNNVPHGIERWGHPRFPHEEGYFIKGLRSGVFRRWNGTSLETGYPHYFIDGKQVTRAEYGKARRARPELPRDARKDDRRNRPLHASLRRAWLRKDLRAYVLRAPSVDD